MNLISCSWCGVVLDKNKLQFSEARYDILGEVIGVKWNQDTQKLDTYVECPVCKNTIWENSK